MGPNALKEAMDELVKEYGLSAVWLEAEVRMRRFGRALDDARKGWRQRA
jgi:hypothetical protein